MKFSTALVHPKTKISGGCKSDGTVAPSRWADELFGESCSGPWLTCYMLRRFGWPNIGSDSHKELCSWCLTTPIEGLYLSVTPYLGNYEKNLHFGVLWSKEVGEALDRDPVVERHRQRIEKAIRRWWERAGAELYTIGQGDPEKDTLVERWGGDGSETIGLWRRADNEKPQRLPAKLHGMAWWFLTNFLEEKHAGVLPEFKRSGPRRPTAFQRRARKALEATLKDLLAPVRVRDVGFSPLGNRVDSERRVEPFEGAGCTPEYWYSQRRKRHERKAKS